MITAHDLPAYVETIAPEDLGVPCRACGARANRACKSCFGQTHLVRRNELERHCAPPHPGWHHPLRAAVAFVTAHTA